MNKVLQLYPDQAEIIRELGEAMRKYKSILLQSPTGSGKTAMAVYMIIKSVEKLAQLTKLDGKKIIFTVPRKDLLEQTSDTLTSFGINHSFIAAGKPYNPSSTVYIGMVQTMAGKVAGDPDTGKFIAKNLPDGYIVLVDETHFGSDQLGKLIKYYKAMGAWVIGLSATPWKLNGQGLGMWYDYMVKGKTVAWLIENKRLSNFDYYYGKHKPDLSSVKVNDGEYNQVQLASVMEKENVIIGDCVTDYKLRCMGKLHIVRCASIAHSKMVAESFNKAGIKAAHVDGDTPMDERKRIFVAFAKREIWVLCFCDLLNFGFDLAQASGMDVTIESCSDLKPAKSLSAQLQFWGRVLRMKPYNAIINDHVNNWKEHDLPDTDRNWTLENQVRRKKGDAIPAQPVAKTRQCPECRCVHKVAPHCPQCGTVYPTESREIEEVDGELFKMDKETMMRMKQEEKYKRLREQEKAETLEDLIKLAQSRGYKSPVGWAGRIYAARKQKGKKRDLDHHINV